MAISYNWLQSYFKEKLPYAEKIGQLFTDQLCEIEGIEEKKLSDGSTDTILDIKVLPDRACYMLSHRGVAYELAVLLGIKDYTFPNPAVPKGKAEPVVVKIETPLVHRYMSCGISGVTVNETPAEIKTKLEALGQRSINSIVDIMNFVMLDTGQPLHAFDADLVKGQIVAREARVGEKMTTLDNKEVALEAGMIVIADDLGPLGVAGIKGGNRAGVTSATKNLVIEAANFDATATRRASTKIGIRTDASKRFENNISAGLAPLAMNYALALIMQNNPSAILGEINDAYPNKEEQVTIDIDVKTIQELLGVEIGEDEIRTILESLAIGVEGSDNLHLTIPNFRKDLRIKEDIVEEVGRIYGYDKVPTTLLQMVSKKEEIIPAYFYEQKIRHLLADLGFSEVFTPTLVQKGEVIIANPLASDKGALRVNLKEGLEKALELASRNAPLLGEECLKIFEIGTVFTKDTEKISLGIGVADLASKGKQNQKHLYHVVAQIEAALGTDITKYTNKEGIVYEIALTDLVNDVPKPDAYEIYEPSPVKQFKQFSPYPFITRDIAVFVPESVSQEELQKIILEKTGPLLVRDGLFDVFKKDTAEGPKVSYAFRLVFQSFERTLTDDEINAVMFEVESAVKDKGWEVR